MRLTNPHPNILLPNIAAVQTQVTDARAYRGIYQVAAGLGHRAGRLQYRKQHSGRAELVDDAVAKYYPAAAADPINYPGVVRYYVDPVSGSDANSGLTWALALKRISTALAKADVDVVLCKGGAVYRIDSTGQQGIGLYTGSRNIVLAAVGPRAIITTAREVTWTVDGTLTNTYNSTSTGGAIVRVLDMRSRDVYGDYASLTLVASKALVDVTPGSYFYASNVVSVRLSDSTVPDTNILCLRSADSKVSAPGVTWYMRNCMFLGGSSGAFAARDGSSSSVIIAEDCWFAHQFSADGYQIKDVGMSIAVRCRASANANDGFNYHELNGLSPHFIEIDCVGMANQALGTGNGSTSHESCIGFRMNCGYAFNAGPGVADVNSAKTFNVNCNSRGNTGHSNASGMLVANTAEMWIDGANCTDNQGTDVTATDTALLHVRGLYADDAVSVAAGATADAVFT